jgi:CHAT domain-containing protein
MVTAIRNSSVIKGRRLPDFDLTSARALYKGLFAPVEAQLAGLQTLHVDGGGVLASLPMGALLVSDPSQAQLEQIALDQDYSDVDWLARHYSLDTALGPAAFVRTRAEGGAAPIPSVVAFGDFVPDPVLAAQRIAATHGLSDRCEHQVEIALSALRALPQTGPEAKNAAAIFGADVADASILVLATHGVLGLSSCFAEPALLTSVGPDGDGLIEASQLLNRALKARLVVLSACNTAGGAGTTLTSSGLADGGEALSGLARAFIYAGAPSVLATQWPIDATASALQTSILLKTASEQGHTLAQALGDAQRSLYSQAETAHPFFWSGFVLIGDGGAVLAGPPTPVASN